MRYFNKQILALQLGRKYKETVMKVLEWLLVSGGYFLVPLHMTVVKLLVKIFPVTNWKE